MIKFHMNYGGKMMPIIYDKLLKMLDEKGKISNSALHIPH